jgi:translation elongation factor EF-Tu-like GTPase
MVIASLKFLGPDEGGRNTPPKTGFRPQIDINGVHTSCVVSGIGGVEEFSFGKEHEVSLALMFPEQYKHSFKLNDKVGLYEGSKLIATGHVVAC